LALGHNPVLDPEILAGMRIGPTRNVAGGKDFRYASLQVFVDDDAPIDLQLCALRQLEPRPYTDTDDDQIGLQRCPAFELDVNSIDCRRGLLKMKYDAVIFMELSYEIAELAAEHAF
jgi:hypothetical protein